VYLNSDDIRLMIEKYNLIEPPPNFDQGPSSRIEGATYDFRLGKVFIPDPASDIKPYFGFDPKGSEIRRLPPLIELEPVGGVYRLYEGNSYIIQSVETFNLPKVEDVGVGIGGLVGSKSSYFVALTELTGTFISPGFSGKLKCKLRCDFRPYIEVAQNYRIGCVKFFYHTIGKCDDYQGIWQGDKVTTDGRIERGY